MSSTNLSKNLYALVDCNSFYVSCERVFSPKLLGKPVVVLTGNDGCVVARSQEAKQLQIPMGIPAFECEKLFKNHDVHVLVANFTLYGDMSRRIMSTLESLSPEVEIYSIDEAFLKLDCADPVAYCQEIKRIILRNTGVPVSIGIGPTKTLAKVANDITKKYPAYNQVFSLEDPTLRERALQKLPVEDVWGIGRKTADFLRRKNIHTAGEFKDSDDGWIKKNLSVVGLRMAWELRGIAALSLDEAPSEKKSITCSRSFSGNLAKLDEIAEALATFTATAAEKLRVQESRASYMDVFLTTNKHHESPYYYNQVQIIFPQPTDYTPHLIGYAKEALRKMFRVGLLYKKTGITLGGLVSNKSFQLDLFAKKNETQEKETSLMKVIDSLNQRYGRHTIKTASEGTTQPWKAQIDKVSPRYTTDWNELLIIGLD